MPAEERANEQQHAAAAEEERVEQDFGALLSNVERERDEYLELAKRTQADFENYRKRVDREAQQAEARGRARVARDLLTVADNLERAIENIAPDPQADPAVAKGTNDLLEGVRLVYGELIDALGRAGVEAFEPAGEPFDPDQHEAMLTQPAAAQDDGKVVQVLSKGYRLDGQVLRPARVAVGKAESQ